ncbi:hypothetical protein [Alteromonas phage PB15]|nr:hypothetical protein [Alteromonas phage PB15]
MVLVGRFLLTLVAKLLMRMTTWPWSRNVSKGEQYTRSQFFYFGD